MKLYLKQESTQSQEQVPSPLSFRLVRSLGSEIRRHLLLPGFIIACDVAETNYKETKVFLREAK